MAENEPGSELDERIAREVFGGPSQHVDWWWWSSASVRFGLRADMGEDGNAVLYAGPKFSTDIAAAWTVAELLRDLGLEIVIAGETDGWEVEIVVTEELFRRGYRGVYTHGAAPLAICRAALHAVTEATDNDGE